MRISVWSSDVCSSDLTARMGFTLRRLMAGRLLGMLVEGIGTWLACLAVGIPMAALMGLLTGLLAFIPNRSEEHTSELQSLMRISYAVFCLKKKNKSTLTIRTPFNLLQSKLHM